MEIVVWYETVCGNGRSEGLSLDVHAPFLLRSYYPPNLA